MNVLVTGGAGFIGRWTVKRLLDEGYDVFVIDDLSNGREENIAEFFCRPRFHGLTKASITDKDAVASLFSGNSFDVCIHLAAQINVQESLDHPERAYKTNVTGTYYILEECRKRNTKLVLMGTCMVYDLADSSRAICETHPTKPASPYAGSKLAAENLAESYHRGLGLPVVILRPFNTYGPFQKSNMEGGVVSIFVERYLHGETLKIFGDGEQTRDLLYVEDCAEFIVKAAFNERAVGHIINAGLGEDVSINGLAALICPDPSRIEHVKHHHPQAEIQKLVCDSSKAKELLGWEPKTSLEKGIGKVRMHLQDQSSPS